MVSQSPSSVQFVPTQAGIQVQYRPPGAAAALSVDQWTTGMHVGDRPVLAILLCAWDQGEARVEESGLLLSHGFVSHLSLEQAKLLGLPEPVPFTLHLREFGTVEKDLRLNHEWILRGQVVQRAQRIGSWLTVAQRHFWIHRPLFLLLNAIESFQSCTHSNMDERLLAWCPVQELLQQAGSLVTTTPYLRSLKVYPGRHFTLNIESRPGGDIKIEPLLLRTSQGDSVLEESQPVEGVFAEEHSLRLSSSSPDFHNAPLLSPEFQAQFERRFAQFEQVQARYALGQGAYLVTDKTARKALAVVKRAQHAPRALRREFVRNPRVMLRSAMEDEPEEVLESVFVETEALSARIKGQGLWQPKVLPWLKKATHAWLPPESMGLKLDDTLVQVQAQDLETLKRQLEHAKAQGETSILYQGVPIPVSQEALDCLTQLQNSISGSSGQELPVGELASALITTQESAQPSPSAPVVLLVEDNLETLTYTLRPRAFRAGDAGLPALRTSLKPHQQEGVAWLQHHWRSGSPGALLADDMGLGKTLQALAFLSWIREEQLAGWLARHPFLIVAPTGLLKNWEEEASRHLAPGALGTLVRAYGGELTGLRLAQGMENRDGIPRLNVEKMSKADGLLTTYETLRDYQHSFARVRFSIVLLDEAQKIKNPAALLTEAARSMHAEFTLLLSGTPVENRLADLWCLADTAQPGALGALQSFVTTYEGERSLDALKSLKARIWQGHQHFVGAPALMMRRLKEERLPSLPQKHLHISERHMGDHQAREYQKAVMAARQGGRGQMLKALQRLRSVSLHPDLSGTQEDDVFIRQSARLSLMMETLEKIRSREEKALIFVESLEMIELLSLLIQRRFRLQDRPMVVSGAIDGGSRQARVHQFQSLQGFGVMLLTPRAGGVGLTLTAANHVLHLSRWWNPAVEDQCTDRVYRIGQERDVHVYHFLALDPSEPAHSFDRTVHQLLEEKRQLSQQLLVPGSVDENRLYQIIIERNGSG